MFVTVQLPCKLCVMSAEEARLGVRTSEHIIRQKDLLGR